jgi:hypothetical protein
VVYGFLATLRCYPLDPKVRTLPNFASTLASLLLIASSIGVNIARYPQVGRTIDDAPAGTVTQAKAAVPADAPPLTPASNGLKAENPGALGASGIEPEPAKSLQFAAGGAADSPQGTKRRDPDMAVVPVPSAPRTEVPILDVRPLIPVASPEAASSGAELNSLRRLPPVVGNAWPSAPQLDAVPGAREPYPETATP